MDNKSFIFGLGCGLLFMSVLFFFLHDAAMQRETEPVTVIMTDAEVTARAKQLGMIFLTEAAAGGQDRNDSADLPAVMPETASETPQSETAADEPPEQGISTQPSDSAEFDEPPDDILPPEDTDNPEPESEPEQPQDTPEDTDAAESEVSSEPAPVTEEGDIELTITNGLSAREIVQMLVAAGVVEDESAFIQYISEHGLATRLVVGTYNFTQNESYDSIARKIARYGG